MRSETVHVFKQMRIFREEKRKIILYLKKRRKKSTERWVLKENVVPLYHWTIPNLYAWEQKCVKSSSYPTLPKDAWIYTLAKIFSVPYFVWFIVKSVEKCFRSNGKQAGNYQLINKSWKIKHDNIYWILCYIVAEMVDEFWQF